MVVVIIILVILLVSGIILLSWAIKFRNNAIKQKEEIESLKSKVRVVKAKYLNVLKNAINTQNEANNSQGNAYGVANLGGSGRFIGGASGSINNFGNATDLVTSLANEYQYAQDSLNYAINKYNIYITCFPYNILANIFKFAKEGYIDSDNLNLSTSLNGFDENEI